MDHQPQDDAAARVRRARQVLAGTDVHPPENPVDFGYEEELFTPDQRIYLVALVVLLVIAIILWALFGLGIASIVFFLLALGLIAGWFLF